MLLFRFLEKEKLHEISIETYVKLKQKNRKPSLIITVPTDLQL